MILIMSQQDDRDSVPCGGAPCDTRSGINLLIHKLDPVYESPKWERDNQYISEAITIVNCSVHFEFH